MGIGRWSSFYPLQTTGLPAAGTVITVKNTGTSTLSTLTNAGGTPAGSSTFQVDSRGNGHFYADDSIGYDLYDSGTLILTDERVVASGGVDVKPQSAIYFVDPVHGNDANDGKSWGSAYATASHALSIAPSGSKINVSPGGVTESTSPDLHGKYGITLVGNGGHGPTDTANAATVITYTGTGDFINAKSSFGICLRDLTIHSTNASFTGSLLNLQHDSILATDSAFAQTERCSFVIDATTGSALNLDDVHSCGFKSTRFEGGGRAVLGIPAGSTGHYNNRVEFDDCFFKNSMLPPILNPGTAWTFNSCTIEPLLSGAAGFIDSSDPTTILGNGLSLKGCWLGDGTAAGTWINYAGNGLTMLGGMVSLTGPATLVKLPSSSNSGIAILGTRIDTGSGGTVLDFNSFTTSNVTVLPGLVAGGITWYANGSPPAGSIYQDPASNLIHIPALQIDPTSGIARAIIKAPSGQQGGVDYYVGGTATWRNITESVFYELFDSLNSRNHVQLTGGNSNTAAVSEFFSVVKADGGLDVPTVGQGLKIAEGTNAKQGTAVLVAGTKTVANTSVTASSRIFLSRAVAGGTLGHLSVGTVTAGTSFVINSSSATDTSTINYEIFEPG